MQGKRVTLRSEATMGKPMGATVQTVQTSHAAMVSHPKEVAAIIVLAAEAQRAGRAAS